MSNYPIKLPQNRPVMHYKLLTSIFHISVPHCIVFQKLHCDICQDSLVSQFILIIRQLGRIERVFPKCLSSTYNKFPPYWWVNGERMGMIDKGALEICFFQLNTLNFLSNCGMHRQTCRSTNLPYKVKTQYLHLQSIKDTSIQYTISLQSTHMLKS